MKICVTGHRPDKLFGYDLNDKQEITILVGTVRQVIIRILPFHTSIMDKSIKRIMRISSSVQNMIATKKIQKSMFG